MSNEMEDLKEDGVTGVIKKADLSRERSEQRTDRFAVGEKVDAKVTAVDQKARNAGHRPAKVLQLAALRARVSPGPPIGRRDARSPALGGSDGGGPPIATDDA